MSLRNILFKDCIRLNCIVFSELCKLMITAKTALCFLPCTMSLSPPPMLANDQILPEKEEKLPIFFCSSSEVGCNANFMFRIRMRSTPKYKWFKIFYKLSRSLKRRTRSGWDWRAGRAGIKRRKWLFSYRFKLADVSCFNFQDAFFGSFSICVYFFVFLYIALNLYTPFLHTAVFSSQASGESY